jgi:hypothetical protein
MPICTFTRRSDAAKASLFAAAYGVRQVEIGLAGMVCLLLGVTAAVLALAVVIDGHLPRWAGLLGVAGGVSTAASGVVIGFAARDGDQHACRIGADGLGDLARDLGWETRPVLKPGGPAPWRLSWVSASPRRATSCAASATDWSLRSRSRFRRGSGLRRHGARRARRAAEHQPRAASALCAGVEPHGAGLAVPARGLPLHRLLEGYGAIVEACCEAWNALTPERLRSLTAYPWIARVSS